MTSTSVPAMVLTNPSLISANSSSSSPDNISQTENIFRSDGNTKLTIQRRLYPESAAAYRTWLKTAPSFKIHVRVPKKLAPRTFEIDWDCCSGCACAGVEDMDLSAGPVEEFSKNENVLEPMEPEDKETKPSSPKRKHDEDEEESWTLVTSKRKRNQSIAGQSKEGKQKRTRRGKSSGSKQHTHSQSHSDAQRLDETTEEISLDSHQGKLAVARSTQRVIRGFLTLHPVLKLDNGELNKRIISSRNGRPLDVKDVVMIGLGNLDDSVDRNPQRAALQTGLFLAIINALMGGEIPIKELDKLKVNTNSSKNRRKQVESIDEDDQTSIPSFIKSPIPTFSQDPAFTPIDSAVLSPFNITTVEHPKGVENILEHTLIYAPFVDVTVLMPLILQDKNPAMYIGVDFEEILDVIGDPEDYAQRCDVDLSLAQVTVRIVKDYLKNMVKVDVKLNPTKTHELTGLTLWVRK